MPVWVEEILATVFGQPAAFGTLLVTLTVTVQVVLAARFTPATLIEPPPGLAVTVGLLHVPPTAGLVATLTLAFRVSTKLRLFKATPLAAAFGLPSVKVKVEVPPTPIVPGVKALVRVGRLVTVRVAVLLTAPAPV